ncbi:MAG: SpoIIE family protein phosphatase [Bacteroidales bacterium]|jgi:sigma-B regulation protein RsbU (phosphoserine phosphatase)|nr:SpoIIE family protein phosphatase [Bacteroidales bacterium]
MGKRKGKVDRLSISKFKLDALLDITLSINANLPKEILLSKYESILRRKLGIGKILIFKYSGIWECLLNGGFPGHDLSNPEIVPNLLRYTETVFRPDDPVFIGVDIIIPVHNNNVPLAYVLMGDIEEEGEGMSPVLKHLNFVQTISSIILVAIENIRLFNESLQQEALRKELELAARMQQMLIPENRTMPKNDKMVVSGFYYPHYSVGGDYYDCLKLSDSKTGFCIADVSGKGISAALLMSNFQAGLRVLFSHDTGLPELIHKLNYLLVANAAGERFITLFIARYDNNTGVLEYINAAHNPPVLYDVENHEIIHLHSSCVGIGMLDEIPDIKIRKITVENTSKLVCYTDGLSELKGDDGEELGTREIIRYISNNEPVEQNIISMLENLGIPDNNPDLFDDVSIMVVDLIR